MRQRDNNRDDNDNGSDNGGDEGSKAEVDGDNDGGDDDAKGSNSEELLIYSSLALSESLSGLLPSLSSSSPERRVLRPRCTVFLRGT